MSAMSKPERRSAKAGGPPITAQLTQLGWKPSRLDAFWKAARDGTTLFMKLCGILPGNFRKTETGADMSTGDIPQPQRLRKRHTPDCCGRVGRHGYDSTRLIQEAPVEVFG